MIKISKKFIISLTTATLMTAMLAITAFAEDSNGRATTLDELTEKYRLEDVTTTPNDIIPIEFNSIEEADLYLESLDKLEIKFDIESQEKVIQSQINEIEENSNNKIKLKASGIKSKTADKNAGGINSDVSLKGKCTYSTDGDTILEITSEDSYLVGNTGNWGWRNSKNNYTKKILDGGRTYAITPKGTLVQYVTIDGKTKEYTSSKSGYFEIYK